ncbi:MAG: cob(I)yrinic acid a,c-diamide adenosyltransferase [Ignavibacteriaceae bacterium]
MKIYTKSGDKGETGLFGGERVSKASVRIEAYGTIDELNSFIGLAVTETRNKEVQDALESLQVQLFTAGADLATPYTEKNKKYAIPRVSAEFITEAEKKIDYFDSKLDELKQFILPGGSKSAALLHICRTICRRAERKVVELKSSEETGDNIIIYLNRLSDLFFVLARIENVEANIPDVPWRNQ